MDRADIINSIYNNFDEDARLTGSRHGQLEYLTTMRYIHQLVRAGSKVLEVGAGTGRYSIALAKEGYDVTAVELVAHNLEILRRNAAGLENLSSLQGDATDLGAFAENSFDAVFLFGPMYHLYEKADQHRAIDEAIRAAKPGGVIMASFLSIYAIMFVNYLSGNFRAGMEENYDAGYRVRHFKEQGFTGFDMREFEGLFADRPVRKIALAGRTAFWSLRKRRRIFKCLMMSSGCLPAITFRPVKRGSFWEASRTCSISAERGRYRKAPRRGRGAYLSISFFPQRSPRRSGSGR